MTRESRKKQTSWLKPNPRDNTFWEKRLWKDKFSFVAGLDEAGRGAWAGPVVAAAVILPPFKDFHGIDDSKKLTPKKRDALYELVCSQALAYGVGIVSSLEIDRINILQATLVAMKQAVGKLKNQPDYLLIDGNFGIDVSIPQKTLIRGDSLSVSIGAASILAKVTRDRLMGKLGETHSSFKFSKHKGYGTRLHHSEIKQHGLIPEHRKSFEPMRSIVQGVQISN